MTTESHSFAVAGGGDGKKKIRSRKKRNITIGVVAVLLILLLLFLVCLILALTVFKTKNPTTTVSSVAVDGVAPRVTIPAMKVELNISLALKIEVTNRNHASFRHGTGTSQVMYRGNQVGEAEIYPGTIPAMSNSTVDCRLTVELDELAGDAADLVSDVMGGEIVFETRTSIPGKVTLLGFVKKHVVTTSDCQLTVGVLDLEVRSQTCKYKTKL